MKPPEGNGVRCGQDQALPASTLSSGSVGWVARLTKEGVILEASHALSEAWEKAPAELLGTPLWSHFPPATHTSLQQLIHQATAEHRRVQADVPGSGERWWEVCLAPWSHESSDTQELLFIAWNITERKQSEESLRQVASANDRLRQYLSAINQCTEEDAALALLVKAAVGISGMDGGAVYLVEKHEAVLRHHFGLEPEFISKVSRRSLETGYIKAALEETGEILDILARFPQQNQLGATYGLRHLYCIALVAEGQPFGILLVACRHADPPHASAVELVRILALETESLFLRLKAEQRLRRISSQQRVILNTAPPGIAHIRSETVVWANAGHDLLLGYDPGESVGILVADHVVDSSEYRRLGREAELEFARGGVYTTEVQMRKKNGTIFWCRLRGQTIDLAHLDEGAIWILEDSSERKRLEATLRENEAFALATLNALTATICVLDQGGRILAVNQAWRSFGEAAGLLTTAAGIGSNYLEICDNAARSGDVVATQFSAGIRAVLAGEQPTFCLEYTCHSPTERRWFLGKVTRFAEASPARLVVAHENLTALKLAEETLREREQQLRQAQKMESIGHLAGGMAHEFNNILAGMMLRLGLAESADAPLASRELARDLEVGCVRAANLVKQLLAFSRRSLIQQKPLDLRTIVANQVQQLQSLVGSDIQVESSSPENLPLVKADKTLIEQVLNNLCLNARDALKQGGRLRIELSAVIVGPQQAQAHLDAHPGQYVCLSVIDTGCGMDDQTLQKLFEPFYTTKEVGHGTGLGLATARGIVQQHQGWIEVQSRIGHGSTFRVYLPALGRASRIAAT